MISLFRNFFQSKIGLPIFIGFLVIVALAFAASDISGSATFGGLTGDDKIAVVDGESITGNEATAAVNNGLDRARQQNPALTMADFIEQGGFDSELDLLIDRYATGLFAQKYGLRAGENLVNSEILQINAFRSVTGEFDPDTYQAALRQQGITDAILRRDIADGLLNQQVLRPAFAAPRLPRAAARHYAALVLERRQGNIGRIPSSLFAPSANPTNAQLTAFYTESREDFIRPERRTIRFARFGIDSVSVDVTPTPAQVAARFEADKALYAAQEQRAITSFVVPTEAAARALVERIRGGTSLEAAAAEAGFNVSRGELRDREAMASATSFALSEAAFAAERGAIVNPARSQLAWYVARVDQVERTPARSLAQVSDSIATQIAEETRAAALLDLSEEIERQLDDGISLADVATKFKLEITAVPEILPDGTVYGSVGQGLNPALRPVIETAFQMDESKPQITEVVPGSQFLIFDVEKITESAAPPLAEVRAEVIAAWKLAEGNKKAREAADRIMKAVRGGKSLADAMREENPALVQIQRVDRERRELLDNAQGGVPSSLILLFSMAQGSTKLLEEGGDQGWFVVDLDRIIASPAADDNPITIDTRAQIANALPSEYNTQMLRAIREDVGVDRNEDAIEALRRTLAGGN